MSETELTLTQGAFDALLEMIKVGKLPDGAVVNERRLADEMGLSRTPVREALGRLEGQNYLRRSGRTLLVNGVALNDILEIMSARKGLEAEAAWTAAGRMSQAKIKELREAITSMDAAEHVLPSRHWEVDDMIHLGIAEASGNGLLFRLISDLRTRTRMFGKEQIPTRFEPGKAEHLEILNAIDAGDQERASRLMREHIESARLAIVHSITGRQLGEI